MAREHLRRCIRQQEQAEADLFALQAALTAMYQQRREVREVNLNCCTHHEALIAPLHTCLQAALLAMLGGFSRRAQQSLIAVVFGELACSDNFCLQEASVSSLSEPSRVIQSAQGVGCMAHNDWAGHRA